MSDRNVGTEARRPQAADVAWPTRNRLVRRPGARATATLTAWLVVLLAGGCTGVKEWCGNRFKVGPDYRRPPAAVAENWIDADDERIRPDWVVDAWWTQFNDPTLDGLVQTAYQQNLDLQTAGTRILEARAQRNIAAGNLFPQSQSAIATYIRGQLPTGGGFPLPIPSELNLFATGFNASWEADFWGRYRRTIIASQATLDASVDGYSDALVMTLADVATNYVQYRTFQQRLDYARRNVKIQEATLDLAETRFNVGTTTNLDVQQAKSNLAQTQSTIPSLETGLRQAGNGLCILLGMPASDLSQMLEVQPIPKAPLELAVGIPADLLRRRPDVRRAERDVAAQSEQIGIAKADLYPRLSINGFIGYTGENLKSLFAAKSLTGLVFPALQWNILNYGRIMNNVNAQDANFRGKVLTYQQTVLRAGREVENALVAFLQTQVQARRLEESVLASERSVELASEQYKGGIADFNRVFNTQTTLVSQQDQLAVARGNIALNMIAVFKALGGGWQSFGAPKGAVGPGHGKAKTGHP